MSDSRSKFWLTLASLFCAGLPLAVLLDTAWASHRGWIADTPAAVRVVTGVALSVLCCVAIVLAIPHTRRWFTASAPGILLAATSSCLALFVAEGALRWMRPLPEFHLRRPNSQLELWPDPIAYPGVPNHCWARRNRNGSRGSDLSPETNEATKVLCLGGSTTESLFLDDRSTWPALLEQRLRYERPAGYIVQNAGHCDYGTAHHLRFVRESPLLERMDTVVLLLGESDLMRYLLKLDTDDHPAPLWHRSVLAGLARDTWNGRLGHGMLVDRTGAAYAHARGKLDFSHWHRAPDIEFAAAAYQHRVEELLDELQARGKTVACISQPVLWDAQLTAEGLRRLVVCRMFPHPARWAYLTPENLRAAMDRYNAALRRACLNKGVVLIDAADRMNGDLRYFYDDYHLNAEGSRRLAELVADELAKEGRGPFAAAASR